MLSPDSARNRIARLAKYTTQTNFGVPWALFEEYVSELESRQTIVTTVTGEEFTGLHARILPADRLSSAVEIFAAEGVPRYVFPVYA